MTKTTKIVLGVGAIALAYYFYTKRGKVSTTSNEKPSEPNSGGSKPPTSEPSTIPSPNLKTTIYTCKDGFKVTQTIDKDKAMVMKFSDPCLKHGGILSYTDPNDVPYQNNKGGCPTGFKEVPMNCIKAPCGVTCVPYAKPNGSF
jgi:hypothetical protein